MTEWRPGRGRMRVVALMAAISVAGLATDVPDWDAAVSVSKVFDTSLTSEAARTDVWPGVRYIGEQGAAA